MPVVAPVTSARRPGRSRAGSGCRAKSSFTARHLPVAEPGLCSGPMPYFKDADDVYANLGLFMRQLAVDPEMTNALKRVDTTFQLRLRNPDSVLTVRTPRDE